MSNVVREAPDYIEAMALMLEADIAELDPTSSRHVGTDLKSDVLPWVMLDDLGGPEDVFGGTKAIDLDVLASTYAEAKSLSSRLVAYFLGYPRTVEVDGRRVTLDRVEAQGPREVPWDESNVRRFVSTLTISFRR